MSFDFRIINGDLSIGSDGDLQKVENTDKLIQDVAKIALTPLGSDIFFPYYGSPISRSLIGNVFSFDFSSAIAANQLRGSIEILMNLQKLQGDSRQKLTPYELIAAIQDIRVEQNSTDPRYYKVIIKILTKALTSRTTELSIAP